MKTILFYLGWGVGGYFAIGLIVSLLFFAIGAYSEGRVSLSWNDAKSLGYIALIWPAYVAFAVIMLISSR